MTFEEWLADAAQRMGRDPLWRRTDYRLASYASDAAWPDVEVLKRAGMRDFADQLYRAISSIGANIAEGYSRSSGADRVRFYEYALGSARESREWYWKGRFVLGLDAVERRSHTLDSIIRLLLTAIARERTERTPVAPRTRPTTVR